MKYGTRFLFSIVFMVCAAGMAQTVSDNTEDEPAVVTVQKDLNQPPDEPVPDLNDTPAAPEKSLAKKDKSIYISTNRAPNQTTSAVTEYDFTDSADKYYGGAGAAKDLGDGKWGMIAGDANGNGIIQPDDKSDYWWAQSGMSGYKEGDFNLNGYVQPDDKSDFWWLNVGRASQVP